MLKSTILILSLLALGYSRASAQLLGMAQLLEVQSALQPDLQVPKKALSAPTKTKILKYTDHEPLGGMRTRFIKDVFFSAIEKESYGRLKIEDHWGSQIASGYDALHVVGKDSAADMAIVVPEYTAKDLPLHQIFKSFPTGPAGDKQLVFYQRVYAEIPAFQAELKKENVVNLLFCTGYPLAFFSVKPMNDLDALKGGKWRTASFWHENFLRNIGAIPVSMPWDDGIYKALQAGVLDGLMVNLDGGYQLKIEQIAPNVLLSKDMWMGHLYLLVMNQNIWNGLEKEDKDAINRAAITAYKTLGFAMDQDFYAQVEDLKKGGAKIKILTPKQLDQWKAGTKYREVQAAWVKQQQSIGVKDVGATLEKVNVIMNDVMKPH